MEKVEKKLTRFRATLKTKRKLSLPVFINQFQQQWAEQHGGAALGNGGLLEVASSASASSFGSLTSIPPAVEKERRNTSPGNPGLHELNRERLSCGGGGGSASGSDSPYATMSRSGSRSRKGSAAFPHHQCHANLITSVSSPGGTTFLVPGSPPYPIVKLSLPDGSASRQDFKSDSRNSNNKSSPFPASRRGVNGLRQCDSLENVCDSSHEDQIENGLGLAAQPAAANAISLPHIHQLSDYDDDTAGQHQY
ncbi:uncharacterized protein LOC122258102 isoform X2 [Penaeus japonicus]|uniref:uncharacterized protein LOC122258102 isoform X2 n=1 Tax=Penaeus japonicus TaxID=27405 RepID=UPI001C7159A9|nr:uncharacterized protein LOC122258102 isoform X2 [Penaeus japonicus]